MKGIALYPTHAERVEIEDFRDMQKIVGGYLDLVSRSFLAFIDEQIARIESERETATVINRKGN